MSLFFFLLAFWSFRFCSTEPLPVWECLSVLRGASRLVSSIYFPFARHAFISTRPLTGYAFRYSFRYTTSNWRLRPGGARPVRAGFVVVTVPAAAREVPFADLSLRSDRFPTTFPAYLPALLLSRELKQLETPLLLGTWLAVHRSSDVSFSVFPLFWSFLLGSTVPLQVRARLSVSRGVSRSSLNQFPLYGPHVYLLWQESSGELP